MRSFQSVIDLMSLALIVSLATMNCCGGSEPDPTPTASDEPLGLLARVPWRNQRLVGSPEPPLPYTTEPVFDQHRWDRPIYAKAEPGTRNLLVVQQGGEKDRPSRILRLHEDEPAELTEFLTIERSIIYGLTFDPDYESNGFVYLFLNGPTSEPERRNRISRFKVNDGSPRQCDPVSEFVIIQWRSMGHDGGELAFGNDGMLYISSGDGTSDSDVWLSAQDVSNLLGGVLRIDLRDSTSEQPYRVPPDNPFVDLEGARGELWAFGLRNPWRLWSDPISGQIWVGNNGQDLWETVHLIGRGENYGWSLYEGSHPFYPERERGPAPIVPPTIEHHHTEARSLTGGVVYRGNRHPELDGAYIYGDYSTGKIWGVRHDGTNITWHQELADTVHQIAGFAITPSTDLLIVDHGGGLHRLKQAPASRSLPDFPTRLSDTGLFESLTEHHVAPGIISYSVNAPGWNDHASAERFLAVPDDKQIDASGRRGWDFPDGSVLLQTLSLSTSDSQKRIETRVLLRQQGEWAGYSYRWNDSQTDAELVAKSGEEVRLTLADGSSHTWQIPSRSECMSCHSRAVNFVLGPSSLQMDRLHDYGGGVTADQIKTFQHIGLFSKAPKANEAKLVDPYAPSLPLDERARSYLHVNCSSCHVEAGGGNARIELEFTRALEDMRLIASRPQHATFDIRNAMLVAPGEPDASVLFARVSRRGPGQMPPLVTRHVDQQGVELLRAWIASLPRNERPFVRQWKMAELVGSLDSLQVGRSLEQGKKLYQELGCIQCHRFAEEGGGAGPDLSGIAKKLKPLEILESIVDPSATIDPAYARTIVTTVDGRTYSGRVEFEDDQTLRLRSPESFDAPLTIKKSDIDERVVSKVSIMPAEMLNTCNEAEILDLIAYLITASTASAMVEPLPAAHAHNDYHHPRPLFDALERGFCGVEADIFLIGEDLLVAHDPRELSPDRTLQGLYLEPLRDRVRSNGGRVYPDGPTVMLLVDIKTNGEAVYERLRKVLAEYEEMLSGLKGGVFVERAVQVVISGDRPIEAIKNDPGRLVGIDGRLTDLDSQAPADLMPLISDRWGAHFSWDGQGEFPADQRDKLHRIVQKAHAAGRRVRFWATPETENLWRELRAAGVDHINTDQLDALRAFLLRP